MYLSHLWQFGPFVWLIGEFTTIDASIPPRFTRRCARRRQLSHCYAAHLMILRAFCCLYYFSYLQVDFGLTFYPCYSVCFTFLFACRAVHRFLLPPLLLSAWWWMFDLRWIRVCREIKKAKYFQQLRLGYFHASPFLTLQNRYSHVWPDLFHHRCFVLLS